ncbi:MAG: L-lactate dehydrogenase [Omnitrophica WOR_2 bacterium RBG_13_41_10]|nr:MAG: L-lactate dehydrogenase [Omnitrophica WOR_2 bacterium RBG_13_41_10]
MRYAYALTISGLARSIVILDLDQQHAEGEVMDLDSGMPYVSPVEISVGDYPDLEDSDLVVITAGKKQKPGQTRIELIKDNVEIFKGMIPQIMKFAKEAIWLVVSNPVDVLSYAAYKMSGKPWQQVMGSGTVLDSYRLRFLLSQHCQVDARNVHAYILGEHGDSEFPVWSKASIGGTLLKEYCSLCNKCSNYREPLNQIFDNAKDFAYKIIEKKGETSYGIGLALVRITEAILKDQNSILPVSSYVENYYDVNDVFLSLPCVLNRRGIREVLKIQLASEEIVNLRNSAQKLKKVIQDVGL